MRLTDNRTESFVKSQVRILKAKILRWTDQMLHAMLKSQFTFGTSVSMNIDKNTEQKRCLENVNTRNKVKSYSEVYPSDHSDAPSTIKVMPWT